MGPDGRKGKAMIGNSGRVAWRVVAAWGWVLGAGQALAAPAADSAVPPGPQVVLPMDRTAYFVGELVPLAPPAGEGSVALEAIPDPVRPGQPSIPLYRGPRQALMLDTSALAPGDYRIEADGQVVLPRLTLVSTLRRSLTSLQDEATPRSPQFQHGKKYTPQEREDLVRRHWDSICGTLQESGVSAVFDMGSVDTPRRAYLDCLARTGAIALVNPDTRPTSFCPTRNAPDELDSMSQRILLAAQANGRYPNFGGFCYGWDTCGYAVGARRMLLIYWGWNRQDQALRSYIDRIDGAMADIFTRRTGHKPVTEGEYISYLLSIRRSEFATMIDLPSKTWLEEIAAHVKPMDAGQREQFEKRLDAWSGYLMDMHKEVYSVFSKHLRAFCPSLRNTASVQIDHTAVRFGQYLPSAYAPLDLRYQSTWNDQVGGPDYAYQWLYTQALLAMGRSLRPTWVSNAIAAAHGRAEYPGKFMRVAAHGLAYGATGIGFALEGFSNILGGMAAKQTGWEVIRDRSGGADVRAGREFLDRFAWLALEGRGDHGVGILFSRSQFQRQHATLGFGQPSYKMLVALVRLGYTPRFVTEEELGQAAPTGIKALVILGQTFPLPGAVRKNIESFVQSGGLVLADANTTIQLPGARRLEADLPFTQTGKPFNWPVPNMPAGDNDTLHYARWHEANAAGIQRALGDVGRGVFRSGEGAKTLISLLQIDGGADAKYVVAVNDSHVATQADWHQVCETLVPTGNAWAGGHLYDLTREQSLGAVKAVECDLSACTARVFGVLAQPVRAIRLSAVQKVRYGRALAFSVCLDGPKDKPIRAVVPLHVSVLRPDGKLFQDFYRATDRQGRLDMSLSVPSNVPAGSWSLLVRSQLDGRTARLGIEVEPADASTPPAAPLKEAVIVRGRAAIQPLLEKGAKVVLPVFDSPRSEELLPAAEKVKAVLARRGVEVEVRRQPAVGTYWLAYDPSEEQQVENARAERGETFGRIKRTTVNQNDWFSALAGWRFGRPVVLLDLAGAKANPVVESFGAAGLLWPAASEAWPGKGKAVVQGVAWALGPRVNAIVIQAADAEGLLAGAEALADLPADRLTEAIEAARESLWRQRGVNGTGGSGRPQTEPPQANMTSKDLQAGHSPQPLSIEFPQARPPTAQEAQARRPKPPQRQPVGIPATVPADQLSPCMWENGRLVEATAVKFLIPDLRFSQALRLTIDAPRAGKVRLSVSGVFRYSDREPMWAAQWEDVLALHERFVPRKRMPMEIEVRVGERVVGRLTPGRTERQEVALEMKPSHGEKDVKKTTEEVVTELSGEADLPAGRQDLFLVHRNIVDGKMTRVELRGKE